MKLIAFNLQKLIFDPQLEQLLLQSHYLNNHISTNFQHQISFSKTRVNR